MVPDYRINLITPEDVGDLSKFQTEFGPVMEAIRCSNNRNNLRALMQSTPAFAEMSMESVEVLNVIIGLKVPIKRNGGSVNMCKAWEEYAEERAAEIVAEAKAEADDVIRKSILNMLREGASVDFLAKTMEGISRKEIEDLAAEVLKK